MVLFKNKSRESLKKLTEKDIQEKLYGSYNSPQLDLELDNPQSARLENDEILDSPVSSKKMASFSESVTAFVAGREKEAKRAQPTSEKKSLSSETERVTTANVKAVHVQGRSFQYRPRKPWFRNTMKKAGAALQSNMQKAISVLQTGVANVVFFLVQLVKFSVNYVHLHHGGLKKTSLWFLGALGLFALFSSVHYLNEKREDAMQKFTGQDSAVDESESMKALAETGAAEITKVAVEENVLKPVDSVQQVSSESQEKAIEHVGSVNQEGNAGTGRFVVQVATYVNEADAIRVTELLKGSGWPAFIKPVPRTGGKVFYSVYIGRFDSYAAAQKVFSEFKKSVAAAPFQDSFIRKLKD